LPTHCSLSWIGTRLPGAVTLVVSKDKIPSLEAIGYADISARKLMRTDALFWIASMSKSITATAMMLLVDEGKGAVG
jgi:CubicO group peptidase (beta-lactamase class C family)